MNNPISKQVNAALIIVGSEILSGRTQDVNLNYLAKRLGDHGIQLAEARIITDNAQGIQSAVNHLREHYDYVFTTGGIGPTHDDITAENVAAAFGVPLIIHPVAEKLLLDYFGSRGVEPNTARMRMARTPEGASLIDNPVSIAPGFCIENVYVMAGVPRIMQAMLENVLPLLKSGPIVQSFGLLCDLPEGLLAAPLEIIQTQYPDIEIGSYPGKTNDTFRVNLVARGSDPQALKKAGAALETMVLRLDGNIIG